MHNRFRSSFGFVPIITLIIAVVIVTIGVAGFYVMKQKDVSQIKVPPTIEPIAQQKNQDQKLAHDSTTNLQTYHNDEYAFEFKYPTNWILSPEETIGDSHIFSARPNREVTEEKSKEVIFAFSEANNLNESFIESRIGFKAEKIANASDIGNSSGADYFFKFRTAPISFGVALGPAEGFAFRKNGVNYIVYNFNSSGQDEFLKIISTFKFRDTKTILPENIRGITAVTINDKTLHIGDSFELRYNSSIKLVAIGNNNDIEVEYDTGVLIGPNDGFPCSDSRKKLVRNKIIKGTVFYSNTCDGQETYTFTDIHQEGNILKATLE